MTLPPVDVTHDPARRSWVAGADGHPDFPVQNLPLGLFSPPGAEPRIGSAIGDQIVDLAALAAERLLPAETTAALRQPQLNDLLGLSPATRQSLRHRLSELLSDRAFQDAVTPALYPAAACQLHLPVRIGDYTDFYAGINHARNVGALFRPDNPLLPNYKHVPIGYHGRASSVRVSGEPVRRPNGQRKPPQAEIPDFGPSRRLDYELELGIWVGPGNDLGSPIPIAEAGSHIAGYCLLNDWSARDLQAWEYQPLGPFLAKNFHSTVSPWVVTAEALAPFRRAQEKRPADDPHPLPYLWDAGDQEGGALDLTLTVMLRSAAMREAGLPPLRLSQTGAHHLYWTPAQLLAHHASNGCDLHPGDLLGTGTISGPDRDGFGSLLEITEGGKQALHLPTGEERRFLEDGDEVVMTAQATREGFVSIGFGACAGVVLPAP